MSKKSIIFLTTLFLIVSSQNSIVQAGYMAGDTDEDTKIEMGQSMHDMEAVIGDEKAPSLREQENQEETDMQTQRFSLTSSSMDNEDLMGSLFRKVGFLSFTGTVLEEMIQNTVLQSALQSETPLLLRDALVDDVTMVLLSKALDFSPTSKTLGEKVEQALEHFALTLGKFAPYENLD